MCFLVGSKVIQAQYKAMGVLPCNGWGAMKDRRLVVGVLYPFEQAHCKSWDMLNVRLRKHVVSLGADGQVVGEEPLGAGSNIGCDQPDGHVVAMKTLAGVVVNEIKAHTRLWIVHKLLVFAHEVLDVVQPSFVRLSLGGEGLKLLVQLFQKLTWLSAKVASFLGGKIQRVEIGHKLWWMLSQPEHNLDPWFVDLVQLVSACAKADACVVMLRQEECVHDVVGCESSDGSYPTVVRKNSLSASGLGRSRSHMITISLSMSMILDSFCRS